MSFKSVLKENVLDNVWIAPKFGKRQDLHNWNTYFLWSGINNMVQNTGRAFHERKYNFVFITGRYTQLIWRSFVSLNKTIIRDYMSLNGSRYIRRLYTVANTSSRIFPELVYRYTKEITHWRERERSKLVFKGYNTRQKIFIL